MRIELRKANIKDLSFFYQLKTDIISKKNSINSKKISLNEHKRWFIRNVKNKNNIYLIAKKKNIKFGIIRYDINDEFAKVSIILEKNYRGLGVGTILLRKSEFFIKKKIILIAKIKKKNKSSIKIFKLNKYKVLHLKKNIFTFYKII